MINKRRGLCGSAIVEISKESISKGDYIEENELH